jgi:hypothetical protein
LNGKEESSTMPTFRGTDFAIELPADFRDESTYAVAFRARSDFSPSVVIKTERLAQPAELSAYVEQQLAKIQQLLPAVTIVSNTPEPQGDLVARTSVYDFGEPRRRLRQKQRYVRLTAPDRVVTLTATSLKETFAETEALFDAVFASFRPTTDDGSTVGP